MYIMPGVEEAPPTVVWVSGNSLNQAVLEAVPDASASPSPAGSGAPDASASAVPSTEPSAAP